MKIKLIAFANLIYPYNSLQMEAINGNCVICFDHSGDLINLHEASRVPHLAHEECITAWSRVSKSLLCPLCFQRLDLLVMDASLNGDHLIRAAAENNWEFIMDLDMASIPLEIVLKALLAAGEKNHLIAFELIIIGLALHPDRMKMKGFFEFFCGKKVPFHTVESVHNLCCLQLSIFICYEDALAQAAFVGNMQVIHYLLEQCKELIQLLGQCMFNAILMQHMEVVGLIVERGFYDEEIIEEAVSMACCSGQLEVLKMFVKNGCWEPENDGTETKQRNLCNAAEYGHLEVVRFLLEAADRSALSVNNFSFICANGHYDVAKLLLDSLSGIDLRGGKDDSRSLGLAAAGGHTVLVRLVYERGAKIDADNGFGLGLAAKNGHLETVHYLVECGADIHANEDYALRWASKHGHLEVVKYLVECGAAYQAMDEFALREARENGYDSVVSYLSSLD